MNFFAKLLILLIPLIGMSTPNLNYKIIEDNNDWLITITGPDNARIDKDGILKDNQIIYPERSTNITPSPLPLQFRIPTKENPQTIEIHACLTDKRCLRPIIIDIPSPTSIYQPIAFSAAIVFNPCFAPIWLVVCTQMGSILTSLVMSLMLTGLQITISILGAGVSRALYAMGLFEIGSIGMIALLSLIYFGQNIFKQHRSSPRTTSKMGTLLATLLSSGCAIPIQLVSGSTIPPITTMFHTWLPFGLFAISTFLFLFLLSSFSHRAYRFIMLSAPFIMKLISLTLIFYLCLFSIQSPVFMSIVIALAFYITVKNHTSFINSASILLVTILSLALNVSMNQIQTHSEKNIQRALKNPDNRLYVSAQWCAECRTIHALLLNNENIFWLDITKSQPWKNKWLKEHNVKTIPACFKPVNNKWQPCDLD